MKLQVEYVPISTIKPYKRNAKLHPQEQIEQIKNSMQEFGNIDPIGVWHDEIVEGHGRYEALKQMGVKEIPIIRLDDLTDEQRKAYALAHNKLTMNSPFDDGILSEELENILDIDMSMFDLGEVFDDSTTKTQTFTGGEIDTDNFSDDKFNTVCPVCGFKFNAEGK
jgi:ParB-like chromosome segregation protein Spo0J